MDVPAAGAGGIVSARRGLLLRRGGRSYRIEMAGVDSIQESPEIAPVPLAPPGVVGVFVSGGRFVGVVDLAADAPDAPPARLVVLARVGGDLVALAADAVDEDTGDVPAAERPEATDLDVAALVARLSS